MKPYESRNSLIEEVRSIVKREIEEAMKKSREGRVNSYSSIMMNAKIDSADIYSSIPSFKNREVFDNKNAYAKMKNSINYGFNSGSKTFVNKASTVRNK